jgi:hypothetical protein
MRKLPPRSVNFAGCIVNVVHGLLLNFRRGSRKAPLRGVLPCFGSNSAVTNHDLHQARSPLTTSSLLLNTHGPHSTHPLLFPKQYCLESGWTRWTLTMIIPWTTSLTMMYASIYIWSGWFRRIQGVIPVWRICMTLIRIQSRYLRSFR